MRVFGAAQAAGRHVVARGLAHSIQGERVPALAVRLHGRDFPGAGARELHVHLDRGAAAGNHCGDGKVLVAAHRDIARLHGNAACGRSDLRRGWQCAQPQTPRAAAQ